MRTAILLLISTLLVPLIGADKKRLLPPGTHIVRTEGGMNVVFAVPPGFSVKKGSSLMVCLHGAGIRDINDNKSVWSGWIGAFTRAGYICIAPRSKTNPNGWDAKDIKDLVEFVKKTVKDYNVLTRQMVAVGHSSGADGAYRLVASEPKLFSALVSLGGQLRPDPKVLKNNNIGVFLYHFNGDPIVNVSASQRAYDTLKKADVDVTLKTENMNSHAIEFYLQKAQQPVSSWLSEWMKKKARRLIAVGEDDNLNWIPVGDVDPRETAKSEKKPFIVYAFSQDDKDDKGVQWLEYDLFPNEEFKEMAGKFVCYKLDLDNKEEMAKKMKIKSSGLYIFDKNGKQKKKLTRPTSLDKVLKTMKKLLPKEEK